MTTQRRTRRGLWWAGRAAVAGAAIYVLTFTPTSLQSLRLGARPDAHESANKATAVRTRAPAAAGVATLDWPTLATLDLKTGVPGAELQRVAGQRVRIPGYIVPLDDGLDEVEDFLLVPYVGACIHVPPPPANQMVLVHMRGRPVKMEWWVPEWIEGTLTVARVDSPYGAAGFTLAGTAVTHYQGNASP